jgi:hypothetical protein
MEKGETVSTGTLKRKYSLWSKSGSWISCPVDIIFIQ